MDGFTLVKIKSHNNIQKGLLITTNSFDFYIFANILISIIVIYNNRLIALHFNFRE
jgi:hypothetical protein